MRLLVFGYKVVSYEYFCEELQPYELYNIVGGLGYTDINLWESTRIKVFSTASMFSKKEMKLKDIIKFPWDEETETEPPTESEINKVKNNVKLMEKILNNGRL